MINLLRKFYENTVGDENLTAPLSKLEWFVLIKVVSNKSISVIYNSE